MILRLIIVVANLAGWLSRATKRGSGVMVTGRFILKLNRNAVSTLSRKRKVILISGTNGKTTTTSLVAAALSVNSKVVSNETGANLFAGIAAALSKNRRAPLAAIEVDEMVIPWAIKQTKPALIVLLNLGRDQLDRLSEVRVVAQKWKVAIQTLPASSHVFADADDPFVVWAAQDCPKVIWFSAGSLGHLDASTCPVCGEILIWSDEGISYRCKCGFAKPQATWILRDDELSGPKGEKVQVKSAIPGFAAKSNAARAIAVASMFGVPIEKSAKVISQISSVDGRFGKLQIGETTFRLLLSKNPSSWRETLTTSLMGPPAVVLIVNAQTQDGKDTSWLWDVDFSSLKGRQVLVTGERRIDVSARLTVNEVDHEIVRDELAASKVLGNCDADIVASYTAFHRLAKMVVKV